ncbi:helix-turn-helix domain-containing protein [Candidatus Clostridium helianthi]|uniref:Helix-turn-helix domain-containing protein n=1 Tax=Candidatus Clostridium helianthi TaxID=3381660 RepID=A0ABW8SDI4_9CLOT
MNDELFCTGIYEDGYGVIPKQVMRDSSISTGAKLVYAYICSFAGAGGNAFPSLDLICSELCISEKKMYKCRNELIDKGLITVKKKRIGSKYSNNIYTLVTNPSKQKTIEPSQNGRIQNEPSKNEPVQNDHVQESEEISQSFEPSQNGHVQNEPCPKVGTISNSIINKKEKRKRDKTEFDILVNEYTKNENLRSTIYEFIKHRKTIKASLTTLALKKILNKLNSIASDDTTKITILENSIMNGWRGIFPLKELNQSNVIPIQSKTKEPVKIDKSKLGAL